MKPGEPSDRRGGPGDTSVDDVRVVRGTQVVGGTCPGTPPWYGSGSVTTTASPLWLHWDHCWLHWDHCWLHWDHFWTISGPFLAIFSLILAIFSLILAIFSLIFDTFSIIFMKFHGFRHFVRFLACIGDMLTGVTQTPIQSQRLLAKSSVLTLFDTLFRESAADQSVPNPYPNREGNARNVKNHENHENHGNHWKSCFSRFSRSRRHPSVFLKLTNFAEFDRLRGWVVPKVTKVVVLTERWRKWTTFSSLFD